MSLPYSTFFFLLIMSLPVNFQLYPHLKILNRFISDKRSMVLRCLAEDIIYEEGFVGIYIGRRTILVVPL